VLSSPFRSWKPGDAQNVTHGRRAAPAGHCNEIGWSHSGEIRWVQSLEILKLDAHCLYIGTGRRISVSVCVRDPGRVRALVEIGLFREDGRVSERGTRTTGSPCPLSQMPLRKVPGGSNATQMRLIKLKNYLWALCKRFLTVV
jgi:hypothetical protein